jgi:hypothetical protein
MTGIGNYSTTPATRVLQRRVLIGQIFTTSRRTPSSRVVCADVDSLAAGLAYLLKQMVTLGHQGSGIS